MYIKPSTAATDPMTIPAMLSSFKFLSLGGGSGDVELVIAKTLVLASASYTALEMLSISVVNYKVFMKDAKSTASRHRPIDQRVQ
jgi:hypothetical protein